MQARNDNETHPPATNCGDRQQNSGDRWATGELAMSDWPNNRPMELSGSDYNGLLEQIEQAERERDDALRDYSRVCEEKMVAMEERDEARAVLGKLYAGRRLSPEEHDLARDCLPQSALEGP